jgi:hypothetical protein
MIMNADGTQQHEPIGGPNALFRFPDGNPGDVDS